jgi:hypothetical protein
LLEDITITNITMRDIFNAPIFLRLGERMRGPAGVPVGEFHRVIISNVVAYNVMQGQGILISGVPGHPIKDVDLHNIKIYLQGNGTAEQAKREVPELAKTYPDPGNFGVLSAYGLFARHVEGLTLDNIALSFINDDQRPAVVFDDVKGAELRFVKAQTAGSVKPVSMNKSEDINVFQSLNLPDGKVKK